MELAELDRLPEPEAARALQACCGSRRWVEIMVGRRPFGSRDSLRRAAEAVWRSLGPADWKEAFASHPRIGEAPEEGAGGLGASWSGSEQAGMSAAARGIREEMARVNREYEARFGFIYLVCATGRSGEELLGLARRRFGHDPETELGIAAAEQLRITLLRLDKLLEERSTD